MTSCDLGDALAHEHAVGVDVRLHVGERPAVAGEAEPRVELLDEVERVQELAGRIGRVAVVVVQRDAAEQVVAGDQDPALLLVEADVRRRVAGRLVDPPGAQVGVDLDARHEVAMRLDDPRDAVALAAARLAVALQRLLGDAALAGDLDAAIERGLGVARGAEHVLVVGVHPQLAAGALDDRRGLPVVVGVRVRADQQPDVLELEVDLRERALEVGHRARLVHAGVDQDDAVAGRQRPGVAVRDARPGQRQPQPPDPRQHPFPTSHFPLAIGLRHRAQRSPSAL